MSLRRKVAAGVAAAAMVFGLSACGGDDDTIKIGTTDQGQKQWQVFEEQAKKEGLNVELVPFGDYSLPNRALQEGEESGAFAALAMSLMGMLTAVLLPLVVVLVA